jgi:hypothetical protein
VKRGGDVMNEDSQVKVKARESVQESVVEQEIVRETRNKKEWIV